MASVLVCGIYLADQENLASHVIEEFASSRHHIVEQRWIALDHTGTGESSFPHTVARRREKTPKFTLLNQLLAGVEEFDALIVADDDITLPSQFLDDFYGLAEQFDFALTQPARTPDSFIDHSITAKMPGLTARETRFVEIGPLFCVRRQAFHLVLPFDELSPMGWGLDFMWPALLEREGLKMGIIDATAVSHRLRKPLTYYTRSAAEEGLMRLFQERPHLARADAFTILKVYA